MATIEQAIEAYKSLKEKKATIDAEYKEAVKPINAKLAQLEAALLNKMNVDGVQSYKTGAGTAFRSTRSKVSCPDKSAFMDFIRANDLFELLEVRPLKSAIEEYKSGRGVLPPGIDYTEEVTLNFRRA